jgi:hypothetical protein
MTNQATRTCLHGLALAAATSTLVRADPPTLEGSISFELQNDYVFEADDPEAEINDLYPTIEPSFALHATPELSLNLLLVLEPVLDPDPGEDRFFEDLGLFVEELNVGYDAELFSLVAGKFGAPFGVAWDVTPGLYGDDLSGDYELSERIGAGGTVRVPTEALGTHELSVATFFADTSILSESAFTNRGRLDEDDGGVGNTEDFSNVSVALDGGELPALPGLNYHLGFSRQEAGEGDLEDELGLAVALYGAFPLTDDLALEPIAEWAHFWDAEGAPQDRDYLTLGTAVRRGPYTLALVYNGRFTEPEDDADIDDHLVQVSAGYAFDFGLTVDLGYRFLEEDGLASHTLGVLIGYVLDFSLD